MSIDNKNDGSDRTLDALTAIRKLMFHNEIVPDQKLAYRDLAKKLGMSPTPVSNALKYLEFQGLVRKELHRGYFTESISIKEIKEIYDLRELIEISLLSESINRLDKDGEKQLAGSFKALMENPGDSYLSGKISKDVHFHMTLAKLSDNPIKARVLRQLFDLLYLKYGGSALFSLYMRPENYSNRMVSSESCHQEIFDAVRARDLKKAKSAMSYHIRSVKKDAIFELERMMEEKNGTFF